MSLMTTALAITGGADPVYYAGRADAHDEHAQGATLAELDVRASYITEYHDPVYAAGYGRRLLELRAEARAMADAQADVARHVRTGGRA